MTTGPKKSTPGQMLNSAMFSDMMFYAGDFNADLLDPDKPPKDGRNLLDSLDIFYLNCLITKATRKTKTRGALGYTRNRKTEEKIIQNRKTAKKFGQNRKPHLLSK